MKRYIDKSEELQKGIIAFPSIYIEGFADSGKTTAVNYLLSKHPEVEHCVIDMSLEMTLEEFSRELDVVKARMREKCYWVIFENLNYLPMEQMSLCMAEFISHMPENGRAIMLGRERPDKNLLSLLWKRKMELIPQEALLLTKAEIQKLIIETGTSLVAKEVYDITGGWAGCVDMILRLSKRFSKYNQRNITVQELRESYEIEAYIQHTIMDALALDERELLQKSMACPWINEEFCEEIFGIEDAKEELQKLRRKGILLYEPQGRYWKVANAFKREKQQELESFWKSLGAWYGKKGYVREALECARKSGDSEEYLSYIQKYYSEIPFSDIPFEMIQGKKTDVPEFCYLRGVYHYLQHEFRGLDREIVRLEKMDVEDEYKKYEILLNLYYIKPDFPLNRWLEILEKYGEKYGAFHLYHILGYSHTYLCGLRDLTGLFACAKKDENQNARIWKTYLGKEEWKCYQLARIDYYLETERQSAINEEDWDLLHRENVQGASVNEAKQIDIARLYLMGKLQKMDSSAENEQRFMELSRSMQGQEDEGNIRNAITCLYSRWTRESRLLTYWLRYTESSAWIEITEENYAELCFMVKGYLQLNQFEKTEKILSRMIPYLQTYHRTRFLAEVLFQQAVVKWKTGHHGQALQSVIESFIVSGKSRYVGIYTNYGQAGKEVLEAYEEWFRTNMPEEWRRKKKYQYGNVLRMPEADYIGVVLRCAKREARTNPNEQSTSKKGDEIVAERLTMMETLVLQNIERGLSNAEICEELNLKLPTVKTHIYSLYKKLGVNSRVQAVKKGKELGVFIS